MTQSSHVDHDTLAMLREVMEDDFGTLIETFLADSEVRLGALQRALLDADSDAVRRAAHSFKGSSSNIGAMGLVNQCQLIESAAVTGELAGLECQLVELQAEFAQVRLQLEVYR